jgi:hypothetical protein
LPASAANADIGASERKNKSCDARFIIDPVVTALDCTTGDDAAFALGNEYPQ